MLQNSSIDSKNLTKHEQPPNFNGLDWVRERRRERGEQREGCETAEKGERRSVERSGGGRWCHQQCDICRKTAPLLPRAPTHLLSPPLRLPPSPLCPGAVPALIKTSFSPLPPSILLTLALSQNSVRLKLYSLSPTFPGCTALR